MNLLFRAKSKPQIVAQSLAVSHFTLLFVKLFIENFYLFPSSISLFGNLAAI